MGGGSKKGGGDNAAADAQARMAEQLFQQTDPLRKSLIGRSQDFTGGGFDVMETPTYLAYKESADRNFGRAKDNAIARLPGGGALSDALVDLEGNRASTLTQGAGAIYGDEINRAMTLGSGITGQSLNSLGQAGAIQAQMAAAAAQENAGKSGALGTGIGSYMGMKA